MSQLSAPPRLDTLARIETPENVVLTFRLAGPWSRASAYLFDALVRAGIILVIGWIATALDFADFESFSAGMMLVVVFLLEWCYPWFFEAFTGGRTPGKKVAGIRVVRSGGYPVGFYDCMVRNILRAADVLPVGYAVGFLSIAVTRRMQRIGDLAADTIVVLDRRPRLRGKLPDLKRVEPLPPRALQAGYRPTERTLHLLEAFFRRVYRLHPARADEIATVLAKPLSHRLDLDDDPDVHGSTATKFLMRVLATFSDDVQADRDSEESLEDLAELPPVDDPIAGPKGGGTSAGEAQS